MCARVSASLFFIVLTLSGAARAQQDSFQLSDAEFQAFKTCASSTGQAQLDACNGYLQTYPKSAATESTLEVLLSAYDQANDSEHVLSTADKLLELNPSNLRALAFEVSVRLQAADQLTDLSAQQFAIYKAAGYARRGLNATKPDSVPDADWEALKQETQPVFESALKRWQLSRASAR